MADESQVLDECRQIAARDVVNFARNPATALHNRFNWNDSEAAQAYRLWQAREVIIQIAVKLVEGKEEKYRIFVSLVSDRKRDGGGYRSIQAILRNPKLRRQFLAEALADFQRWKSKYHTLVELAEIFDAGSRTIQRRKEA